MTQPVIYMIAGPNGAGKTTAALKLLPDFLSVHEFVNADEIARGLNPLNPDGQNIAAGRLMLERMRVRLRVAQGGHDIPVKDIERRYRRGLKNLIDIYLPLVDQANIVNGTFPVTGGPEIIVQKYDADWLIHKPVEWETIQKFVKDSGHE